MAHNCSQGLLRERMEQLSRPIMTSISIISLIFNVCNIVIFSKKKMVSPTNSILLGIAISDFCKVLMFFVTNAVTLPATSYASQVFYLFCNVAMFLMHAFALWCGVLLALFRFFYLRYYASPQTKIWFGLSRARLAVCLVFAANIVAMVPYARILRLQERRLATGNATFSVAYTPVMLEDGQFEIRMFNSTAQKILPCLIMTVFCVFIIHSLHQTEKRRESLANLNKRHRNCHGNPRPAGGRKERRSRDHRRTTSFLLIIMILYILYEIPMSLLIMLSHDAFDLVQVQCFYIAFSGIFNSVGLVNNTANFILYCFMSKQFRDVFKEAFGLNRLAAKMGARREADGSQEVVGLRGCRQQLPIVETDRSGNSGSELPSNPCLEY